MSVASPQAGRHLVKSLAKSLGLRHREATSTDYFVRRRLAATALKGARCFRTHFAHWLIRPMSIISSKGNVE